MPTPIPDPGDDAGDDDRAAFLREAEAIEKANCKLLSALTVLVTNMGASCHASIDLGASPPELSDAVLIARIARSDRPHG